MNTARRFLAVLLLALTALSGCGRAPIKSPPPVQPSKPPQLVVPTHGAYLGAYIDFGDREDEVTLEGIESFEQEIGKHQAIVAFSSYWGERHFPTDAANVVVQHGAVPMIYWSPWDWPYREAENVEIHPPDTFALDHILAGASDAYIDAWADEAKRLNTPILVSFCNEPNGYWFPWSAVFYGGGLPVPGSNPPRYVGPEFFKTVYRYVVDRVRARGATNVLWVLQLNNYSDPFAPWNAFAQFYPGDNYVDWLGLSVYGQQYPDDPKWEEFDSMMESPYEEICRLSPTKPVMLAEWGVGEFPDSGDKADWIAEGFEQMRTECPRLHAAVYWNERWQNNPSQLYSNLRVNSSPGALKAYQQGAAAPFWLSAPIFK